VLEIPAHEDINICHCCQSDVEHIITELGWKGTVFGIALSEHRHLFSYLEKSWSQLENFIPFSPYSFRRRLELCRNDLRDDWKKALLLKISNEQDRGSRRS
jgi:hypothetical protein